jgi:hypothetical protein
MDAPSTPMYNYKWRRNAKNSPHREIFPGSEVIRDIVIEMSNGLTVPFALAAGLPGIASSTAIVITGGRPLRSALQTALIGSLAAAAAFSPARQVSK